jgi:signal transduction histidine kinase/HAMP domain-containing protein
LRSIRFRIVAAFVTALLTLATAQGFLYVQQRAVISSIGLVNETYLPLAKVVARLAIDRQRVDNDVQRLLRDRARPATGATSPAAIYTEELRQQLAEARIHARSALAGDPPAAEAAALNKVLLQLDRIDALFQDYQGRSADLVAAGESGRMDEAQALAEPLVRDGTALGEEIDKLARLVDGRIAAVAKGTEEAQTRATALAAGLTALGLALGVGLVGAVLVALRPIRDLVDQVQRLAAGDYTGRVDVPTGDEIGELAGEVNAMAAAVQVRDRTLVERADELNRLSRYLASVLDSLEEALVVVEDGRVTLANPAAARVWGALPQASPPDPIGELAGLPGRHSLDREDGTAHEIRVTPFGEGGAVVVIADVTAERRAAERLARSERLALVGQMLAQITHEVRNPLNAMSLNGEMLAEEIDGLDPDHTTDARDLLATITGEIERLTAVTGHYLQLARRPPARLEPTDLPAALDGLSRLVDAELAAFGVRLTVDVPPLRPVLVDGAQLRQAVLNVIRNACESGATHLSLVVRQADGQLRLALTDDGPGMDADQLSRATDPFFSTKASGTGLGLAITRQILEDHDGFVAVGSAAGQGTTVELVFPYRPAPEARADEADHPGRR